MNLRFSKNESFFSNPNIINAWVAGLLASDGYISIKNKNNSRVGICLDEPDKNIVEEIKRVTNFTGPIYERKTKGTVFKSPGNGKTYSRRNNRYGIQFGSCSKYWEKDLINIWNIVPRKSLILQPPKIDNCSQDVILAFIQGVIEGDGSINILKSKFSCGLGLGISIFGSKDLLEWIKNKINDWFPNSWTKSIQKKGDIYFLYITGKQAAQLGEKILSLPTHKMGRKWDKVKFYLEMENDTKNLDIKLKNSIIKQKYNSFIEEYKTKYNKIINEKQSVFLSNRFSDFAIKDSLNKQQFISELVLYLNKYSYIINNKNNYRLMIEGRNEYLSFLTKGIKTFFNIQSPRILDRKINDIVYYKQRDFWFLYLGLEKEDMLPNKFTDERVSNLISEDKLKYKKFFENPAAFVNKSIYPDNPRTYNRKSQYLLPILLPPV